MNVIEGFLLVPPDRGSLIGRAAWKPRYIVLGNHVDPSLQNGITSAEKNSKSRIHLKSASKSDLTDISEANDDQTQLYLSIYKAKGEWEFLAHHPISSFHFCEIRSIQHRKQSPPMPTLVIELKIESTTSKLRKRRSSRAGLTFKDGFPNTLLFRSVEGERNSIYDWVVQMKLLLTAPSEPGENAFKSTMNLSNSFIIKSNSGSIKKKGSQNRALGQINTSSSHTSIGKYSDIISPSPSLRSRRSDLSSKASSLALGSGLTSPLAFASGLNSDYPSPSSTSGYDHSFIEGRATTQVRTSALSSHTRGNNSNASGMTTSTTRETILDRAFQMRCIPGSERLSSPEETDKLSSTARFEALMRQNDQRKQARQDLSPKDMISNENSNELDSKNSCEIHLDNFYTGGQENDLPMPAQRALDFISGRRIPTKDSSAHISNNVKPTLNSQALSALLGDNGPSDDHDRSTSQIDTMPCRNSSRPPTLTIPLRSFSSTIISMKKEKENSNSNSHMDNIEKRQSSTSVKHLSFQEFARRLSSTSSLLLVQTNASSNSGRDSGDYTTELSTNPRSYSNKEERDRRCSWRGSVNALSVEGTFM